MKICPCQRSIYSVISHACKINIRKSTDTKRVYMFGNTESISPTIMHTLHTIVMENDKINQMCRQNQCIVTIYISTNICIDVCQFSACDKESCNIIYDTDVRLSVTLLSHLECQGKSSYCIVQ